MTRTSRRRFLRTAAGLVAGLAVGCGQRTSLEPDPPVEVPFADRELRLYVSGQEEVLRETFVPAVQKQTGAKVTLSAGPEGIQKLKAGGKSPPFDLLLTDAVRGRPAAREGLLAQLDWKNVPRLKAVAAAALDDPVYQSRHGVPFPESATALAYHRQRVGNPPQKWDDLLRGSLAGKVGLDRSFQMSLYTFACVRAALNGKKEDTALEAMKKELDRVLQVARDNRGVVKLWWSAPAEMIRSLEDGKVAIGNAPSNTPQEDGQLGAVVPRVDRAFSQAIWCVAAGSANQDVAEKAIDVFFGEQVQSSLARRGWPTAVAAVAEKVAAEDATWKRLYPNSAEQFAKLRYLPYDVYAEHHAQIAEAWERTVLNEG